MKARTYSVAEARRDLSGIVREAERGRPAQITRRGKPVATVVSTREFESLTAKRPTFARAYRAWREACGVDDLDVGPSYFDGLRDRSVGRDVEL